MTAYLAALAVCAVSLVLGAALCARPGAWSWAAPPAGLAAAVLIALVAVRLPGHGATAAAALALAVALSVVRLRRARVHPPPALPAVPIVLGVLAFCSLPFIANDRFGVLGASMLDDLAFHMAQADAMRILGAGDHVTAPGYPTGPHALVAALNAGTGIGIEPAFSGLLLAVPILTALCALSALGAAPRLLAMAGAGASGVAYLASAYLAQGAFKEPLLALFVLGFTLMLREAHRSGRVSLQQGAALVLTAAGGAASFGVAGLAWPAAVLLWLAAFELAAGRRTARRGWAPRHPRRVLAAAAGLGLAALLVALRSRDFFDTGPGRFLSERGAGGNYTGQLDPLEALGAWPSADFRIRPDDRLVFAPGLVVATAVVLFGAVWCWRRRERALLAGAAAAASVYLVARPVTLAYFSGKALVVAAPILTLVATMGLVAVAGDSRGRMRGVAIAAFAAYLALVAYSSALTLRGAHVRPTQRGPDLTAFSGLVRGQPTLYLGRDNFAGWDLRGARLWGFQQYRLAVRLEARPEKASGEDGLPAVDVDSIDSRFLDGFRYLVGPRTAFASRPPANFRVVRRTRWHLLWQRTGRTGERRILGEGEAPGAVLDCGRGPGRRLARAPGTAFVRPAPVIGRSTSWRLAGGPRTAMPVTGRSPQSLHQRLTLAPGAWELSLRYFSDVPLGVRAGGLRSSLSAYLGDGSSFVTAGRVVSRGGPMDVEVTIPARRRVDVARTVVVGSVAATRLDQPGRLVPLRSACSRYVDWFAVGRGAGPSPR